VLNVQEYGEVNQIVNSILYKLAIALFKQGKVEEGFQKLEAHLKIEIKLHGGDHPYVVKHR
jgi:hypothetical protein